MLVIDHVQVDELDGTCVSLGKEEKFIQDIGGGNLKEDIKCKI
jgi:hypothetical protein